MRFTRTAIAVSLAVLLVACAEAARPGAEPGLDGTWQLERAIVDGVELELIESHPVTIQFDGRQVGGTAACNTYGGALVEEDTRLIGEMSITEMACIPPETMELESAYMAALTRVTGAVVQGESLKLEAEGIELTFTPKG